MSNPIELIDRYLDGAIADGDADALRRWLDDDPSHLAGFIRASCIHRALRNTFVGERNAQPFLEATGGDAAAVRTFAFRLGRYFARPTPLSLTVSAAVLGLLLSAMYFMVPPFYRAMTRHGAGAAPSYEIVAQLTGVHEAAWPEGQVGTRLGSHLMLGHCIRLDAGLAEVTFKDGARAILEGPAVFRLDSRNSGNLELGRLVAHVPEEAKGFVVHTEDTMVVDLGTEFGVEADPAQGTHVAVFEGEVELRDPRAGNVKPAQAARLRAGESVQVRPRGRAVAARPSALEFRRHLPPPLFTWGLIAHWKFDDPAGSATAADSAGQNTGTLVNFNRDTDWVSGKIGGALAFSRTGPDSNSAGDHVIFSSPVLPAAGPFTVSVWVKFNDLGPDSAKSASILSTRSGVIGDSQGFDLWFSDPTKNALGNNSLHARIYNNAGIESGMFNPRSGVWHHVVSVFTGSSIELFVNGKSSGGPQAASYNGARANQLVLGKWAHNNTRFLDGALDDVAIWNCALGRDEIERIFALGSAGNSFDAAQLDERQGDGSGTNGAQ